MENPVAEITRIIKLLCTAPPDTQRAVIETYFTPTASFTHPFCRTGSFYGSQWLIIMVYRWYKILSPHIDVAVDGIAFDEQHLRLYVSIHQNFRIWLIPFYNAPVKLVTVLQLTTDPTPTPAEHGEPSKSLPVVSIDEEKKHDDHQSGSSGQSARHDLDKYQSSKPQSTDLPGSPRYWIQSQNDLYQTTEWIKFLLPWGLGVFLLIIWQLFATLLCVAGTKTHDTLIWIPELLHRQSDGLFRNGNGKHSALVDD